MSQSLDKESLTSWSGIIPGFFRDAMAFLFPPLAVLLSVLIIDTQFSFSIISLTPYAVAISEWASEGDGINGFILSVIIFLSPIIAFPFLYVIGHLVAQLSPLAANLNPFGWSVRLSKTCARWAQWLLVGRITQCRTNHMGYAAWDRSVALAAPQTDSDENHALSKLLAYQEMAANCAALFAFLFVYATYGYFGPAPSEYSDVFEGYATGEWQIAEVLCYGGLYLAAWMRFQALEFLIRERIEGSKAADHVPRGNASRSAAIRLAVALSVVSVAGMTVYYARNPLTGPGYAFADEAREQAETSEIAEAIDELSEADSAEVSVPTARRLMNAFAVAARNRPWDRSICVGLTNSANAGSKASTPDVRNPRVAIVILERAAEISASSSLTCTYERWRVHWEFASLLLDFNSSDSRKRAYDELVLAERLSRTMGGEVSSTDDARLPIGQNWYTASTLSRLAQLEDATSQSQSALRKRTEIRRICASISQAASSQEYWKSVCNQ